MENKVLSFVSPTGFMFI